jgi:arylformamidase
VKDGMLHWPGDGAVRVTRTQSIADGAQANLSRIEMSAHTGTHMDAPLHFIADGDSIETMPLATTMGPARVIEIEDREAVRAEELAGHGLAAGERILLKTRNSSTAWAEEPFREDFVHIEPEAAELIAAAGVRLVGVDYLSVGGMESGRQTHQALLGAGVWIIEGLYLSGVGPGDYELLCLPLRLMGAEGAPARALLRPAGGEERE